MRVLIIEDDQATSAHLQKGLVETGHQVDIATTGDDGLKFASNQDYQVLVVDRMLPGLDGLSLIAKLRENHNKTPALVLSALGEINDRVEGLRAGGDDYLTKPFAFSELLARLEALARRDTEVRQTRITVGELEMDLLLRTVKRGETVIDLRPREFRMLEFLMRHSGQVVTRAMLLENIWDYNFDPQTNVVDVHISQLRRKIDKNFATPLLNTVHGTGFILAKKPAKKSAKKLSETKT